MNDEQIYRILLQFIDRGITFDELKSYIFAQYDIIIQNKKIKKLIKEDVYLDSQRGKYYDQRWRQRIHRTQKWVVQNTMQHAIKLRAFRGFDSHLSHCITLFVLFDMVDGVYASFLWGFNFYDFRRRPLKPDRCFLAYTITTFFILITKKK